MSIDLPNCKNITILVVGDLMLDSYWYGLTNRISPEAPVPVVQIKIKKEYPGGSANVAMNIASLGAQVILIGIIGNDNAAEILTNKLKKANIHCDFIKLSTYSTINKLRILSHNQQLMRLDFEQIINDNKNTNLLLKKIKKHLLNVNGIVFSDYNKGTLLNISKFIQLSNKAKIPILIDPKGNNFQQYSGATLLTPNMKEFETIVGKCINNKKIEQKGMDLINSLNIKGLVITRSEEGITLLQNKQPPLHLPTQAQKVYSVSGAGDTVIAILATALASGMNLYNACILANTGAGITVGKLGTSTISSIELKKAPKTNVHNNFGIMDEKKLQQAILIARKHNEKIVMTNGCFDILHAGHVMYLDNARKLGDRLIVAINSNSSIKRLKGNNRPINSLIQRMIVLNALNSVDWVISFEEDTPINLINKLKPDILVKGGDYKLEEIIGGQEVLASGGEVRILNFESQLSTSNIINKNNIK